MDDKTPVTRLHRRVPNVSEVLLRVLASIVVLTSMFGVVVVAASILPSTPTAVAAGGVPFTCTSSTIFLMQGDPTQLNTEAYGAGVTTFTALGSAGGGGAQTWEYNAMGYDTTNNFLYATGSEGENSGQLIQIDSTGTVTDVGRLRLRISEIDFYTGSTAPAVVDTNYRRPFVVHIPLS